MSNNNNKQNKVLEAKAKAGWRCFFELRKNYEELIDRKGNKWKNKT